MLPFLERMIQSAKPEELIGRLQYTAYDELTVIHLADNTYESRYHTDGKFFSPVLSGGYDQLVSYSSGHMVHPEDREEHLRLMDPLTMEKRLAESSPEGILSGVLRYLGIDGNWRRMQHLLVGGKAFGLSAKDIYFYIYDIQDMMDRERGQHIEALESTERMRGWMPDLLTEASFFSLCDDQMLQTEGTWCMIAVDIKHFKLFKDLNGQEKGDRLLIRFGEVLHQTAERQQGLACYRGQDDYGLFVPYEKAQIDRLFADLCAEIETLTSISGFYPILGICLANEDGVGVMELFNRAALTAEEIKDDLRYHIRIYNPELHERHVEEFRLLADFQESMANDRIGFYLQPQVQANTGRIVGAESLARWRMEDGTFVSPTRFVPVLEKYGVVTDLDMRIWEKAGAWLRRLMDEGVRPVPVSLNVSRINIFSVDVPAILTGLTEKYHLPPDLLKVEITESAYVDDADRVRETIADLKRRGFKVMMDDFGSGYSSLNMLRTVSVDVIKLDAQFLRFSVGEEEKGINILESVVNMTKSLSTPIIVEGVETRELVHFLRDLGCRYMQGYYYYRPMPPAQFESLLRDESNVDYEGIVAQRNRQMHTREFLDESIYSDAMLNNILGPVAFYQLHGDDVDIIRFNQQFVDMIGLDTETLERRRYHIQHFFHPDDTKKFFELLETAERDRINGASGIFRIYKPNGAIFWMQLHVYLLQEESEGKTYYGSARDMTELQYINQDLPGGYYRCSLRDGFEFLYLSETLLKMLGYTRKEIADRFGNELIPMIHPKDRERVMEETRELIKGTRDGLAPYRVLHHDGSYRYVLDQSRITDQYGELCWQSVLVDVSELMILRNRMHVLETYSTDCIVFIYDLHHPENLELACYGMEEVTGIDRHEFLDQMITDQISIRDGAGRELFQRVKECDPKRIGDLNGLYQVTPRNGRAAGCHVRFSRITDPTLNVECIMSISAATGK